MIENDLTLTLKTNTKIIYYIYLLIYVSMHIQNNTAIPMDVAKYIIKRI